MYIHPFVAGIIFTILAEIAFGIMEKRVFKRKVYAKILQWSKIPMERPL